MNRIIASVGLVALGAASVQAQSISTPPAKWWNVSATVRGFYDDNIDAAHKPTSHDRVWGGEISPGVGITVGNDQTTLTADYKYAFLYYDKVPAGQNHKYDQDHTFNVALNHVFNECYSVRAHDSFVIGQEPDSLRWDAAFHTPYRVSGNNKVNYGGFAFDAAITPELSVEVGYDNAWFDYQDSFANIAVIPSKNIDAAGDITASLSGALDRVEQTPHVSVMWHVQPDTTASLSYQFGQTLYTANEFIAGNIGNAPDLPVSDDRDVRSHTLYLGLDHQFRPDFYGSVQAGATYYDYYNVNESSFGPYARLSLTYVYAQESSVQVGFQEGRAATDIIGGTTKQSLVTDAEDSVLYGVVRQRIIPNLFLNLNGSAQNSIFQHGGAEFNDKSERFYEFGANLEYVFNANFSAHIGYDFDRLDSEIPNRSYSRNKAYIGATASY